VFRVICAFEDGTWRLSLKSDYQLCKPAHSCAHAREISRLILDFLCRADKRADMSHHVKLFFLCSSLLQFHEFLSGFRSTLRQALYFFAIRIAIQNTRSRWILHTKISLYRTVIFYVSICNKFDIITQREKIRLYRAMYLFETKSMS